jgi:hypothetical protein
VAVGAGAGDVADADRSAGAGDVLDDHRLAEARLHAAADGARDHVARSARGERTDDDDGPVGEAALGTRHAGQEEAGGKNPGNEAQGAAACEI